MKVTQDIANYFRKLFTVQADATSDWKLKAQLCEGALKECHAKTQRYAAALEDANARIAALEAADHPIDVLVTNKSGRRVKAKALYDTGEEEVAVIASGASYTVTGSLAAMTIKEV